MRRGDRVELHDGYFEPWPSPGSRFVLPSGWTVFVGHERDLAIHLGDGFEVYFDWLMSASNPPETNLRLSSGSGWGGRVPATAQAVPGPDGRIGFVLRPCPTRTAGGLPTEVRALTQLHARIYRPALEPFLDVLVSAARSTEAPALDDDEGLWMWMGGLTDSGHPACHFMTGEALAHGGPFVGTGPRPSITELWGDHLVCDSVTLPPPKFPAETGYLMRHGPPDMDGTSLSTTTGPTGSPRGASLGDETARAAVEANRHDLGGYR